MTTSTTALLSSTSAQPRIAPRNGRQWHPASITLATLGETWRNLEELIDTYARLKSRGIMPTRPIRHGLTLSLYYRDPDGNGLEFQIDLMEAKAANEFMSGPAFAANPVGEPFDPEALAARLAQGKPVNDLIFRSDQAESKATPGVVTEA
jgi:hypothetical protein